LPTGIKVVSVLFVLFGSLLLISSIPNFLDLPELLKMLERSNIAIPVFILTNVVGPVAMIAGGIGLWSKALWAWWICVIVEGIEVSTKTIMAFTAPHALLGTYPLKQNVSLLIAVAVLVYLFNKKIFQAFHGEEVVRKKMLGVLALVSFVVGGLIMWQAKLSMEAMRSNIPLQATPKDGAPELNR
jgi:hypothetical protein